MFVTLPNWLGTRDCDWQPSLAAVGWMWPVTAWCGRLETIDRWRPVAPAWAGQWPGSAVGLAGTGFLGSQVRCAFIGQSAVVPGGICHSPGACCHHDQIGRFPGGLSGSVGRSGEYPGRPFVARAGLHLRPFLVLGYSQPIGNLKEDSN